MSIKISEEESLLLQGLATTSLLAELSNSNFLSTPYFSQLKFKNNLIEHILIKSSIGNPACLQIMLYSLLVLPKELSKKKNCNFLNSEFLTINQKIEKENLVISSKTKTNYLSDKNYNTACKMNYIGHIRNAVSHSRCYYSTVDNKNFITFTDSYFDKSLGIKYSCRIKMECSNVGKVLEYLQESILKLFKNNHNL